MRQVPLQWTELETAFERNAPEIESYLDLRTGEVVTVAQDAANYQEMKSRVQLGGELYVRVDPAPSREQYRWMEQFVSRVTEPNLRERLLISIDGKGAFRRFKDVLLAYPQEREDWFTYRSNHLHWLLHKWLEKEQIESTVVPPWPEPTEPIDEPVTLEKPAIAAGENPTDLLRRQAKDLIDEIPGVDLAAAMAFLSYLRDRGVADLVRKPSLPAKRTAA